MAHSEKCPVCDGTGKYQKDWSDEKKTCHGCSGRGWIVIGHELMPYIPQPYYPWQPRPYREWWEDQITWGGATTTVPNNTVITGTTYQLPEDAQISYT